jgi:hypothetical protein
MTAFYDHLLSLLPQTAIGRGEMEFCETGLPHCFAMKWKDEAGRINLVLVNLAPQRASFQIREVEPEWKSQTFTPTAIRPGLEGRESSH